MSQKLPPNFDAERYAAAYPDVALSGLDPREHYLRFGRLMGRSHLGKLLRPSEKLSEVPVSPPDPRTAKAARKDAELRSEPSHLPITDRPTGFNPAEAVPLLAPPKAGANADSSFTPAAIANGHFASQDDRTRLCAPLAAYVRIVGLPCDGIPKPFDVTIGARRFQTGGTRIDNAWFAERRLLRLMIGGSSDQGARKGWVVRAYQAAPATPGELKSLGDGVQLSTSGPVFHDFEMIHPLMPLLLELSDPDGATQDIALIPFPSLLPGGAHGAELRALQDESNPMDAFWRLSEQLLRELIGGPDSRERSIAHLTVVPEGQSSPSALVRTEFHEWLSLLFGLSVSARAPANGTGLRLTLPADSWPTVSALVSRRLDLDGAKSAVGPFLVAEDEGFRPRWSVSLPTSQDPEPSLPVLSGSSRRGSRTEPVLKPLQVPLAIALRNPAPPQLAPPDTDPAKSIYEQPLTVIVSASDNARTETLVRRLEAVLGSSPLQLLVLMRDVDTSICTTLEELRGPGGWTHVQAATDLRELAQSASHELMLTISDRVAPSGTALRALAKILQRDGSAASVSCALLGETVFKKQTVAQPASGGLFPARVSFATSPRLGFWEPDVLQALPNLTYPVIANTLLFTLWRTKILTELPSIEAPLHDEAADIRTGLDLMAAGFRNLCTTHVSVRLRGPYARRNAIDPVGATYLQPSRWENLLDRVTVIRELF
jgi:hypothetical protein